MIIEYLSHNFNNVLAILICAVSSLIWPTLLHARSKAHHLFMFLHSIFFAFILYFLLLNYHLIEPDNLNYVIMNGFQLSLKISKLGIIFASLIAILWPAAYFYSIGYMEARGESFSGQFLFFLNLSISFAIFLSLAGNLLTMFIFYELLTLSTIPLIAHNYKPSLNKALKNYLSYLLGGSVLLWLPTILYIQHYSSSQEFEIDGIQALQGWSRSYLITLLCFSIFGITKAAIFPFHSWLPKAMAANYPTSAILHAVIVVNSGIYCLYKVFTEIFGIHLLIKTISIDHWLQYLLLIGIIYSAILACVQNNVKKILAWSTVSQLNLITLIAISGGELFLCLSFQGLIYHSFCKITLFFICGYIYVRDASTTLKELRGSAQKYKILFSLFAAGCLTQIGMPIFIFGEHKNIILHTAHSFNNQLLLIAIISSSILSLIYFGKIIIGMCLAAKEDNILSPKLPTRSNRYMLCTIIYSSVLVGGTTLYNDIIFSFIRNFL